MDFATEHLAFLPQGCFCNAQTWCINSCVVSAFPKPCIVILCANQDMVVNMLMHGMLSIGRSLQIYAMSHLANSLSALSGQSYGCRISLKPYAQLQPILVVSSRQLQKQHDQLPGCFTLWSLQDTKHEESLASSNFTHCIT